MIIPLQNHFHRVDIEHRIIIKQLINECIYRKYDNANTFRLIFYYVNYMKSRLNWAVLQSLLLGRTVRLVESFDFLQGNRLKA